MLFWINFHRFFGNFFSIPNFLNFNGDFEYQTQIFIFRMESCFFKHFQNYFFRKFWKIPKNPKLIKNDDNHFLQFQSSSIKMQSSLKSPKISKISTRVAWFQLRSFTLSSSSSYHFYFIALVCTMTTGIWHIQTLNVWKCEENHFVHMTCL